MATSHDGCKTLIVFEVDELCKIVHFELDRVQNNIRARQVEILGQPDKPVTLPVQLLLCFAKRV